MTRPPDPIWDIMALLFGYTEPITRTERGRLNKAVKDLKDVGATPEEIKVRFRNYVKVMPQGCICTPMALVSNWSLCGTVKDVNESARKLAEQSNQQLDEQRAYEAGAKSLGQLRKEMG